MARQTGKATARAPEAEVEDAAPEADVSGPRSLTRVLGLFDLLSLMPQGMTLSELCGSLGTPKSSLLNLLRPLVAEGYLVHVGGRYCIGHSLITMAAGVMSAWNFSKMIRPFMEELVRRTEETVLLGVLNRETEVLAFTEIINSPHPVRLQVPVGTIRPLYASPAGWVVLAYADKAFRDQYIASVQFKLPMREPLTRVSLARQLAQVREDGVASAISPTVSGASGIAAPVFGASGECVAALTIAGPSDRFERKLDALKATLKDVAAKASGVFREGHLGNVRTLSPSEGD
jgi:DNA-binding IclR family transcriptional regulator